MIALPERTSVLISEVIRAAKMIVSALDKWNKERIKEEQQKNKGRISD